MSLPGLYLDEDAQASAVISALRSRNIDVLTTTEAGMSNKPPHPVVVRQAESGHAQPPGIPQFRSDLICSLQLSGFRFPLSGFRLSTRPVLGCSFSASFCVILRADQLRTLLAHRTTCRELAERACGGAGGPAEHADHAETKHSRTRHSFIPAVPASVSLRSLRAPVKKTAIWQAEQAS